MNTRRYIAAMSLSLAVLISGCASSGTVTPVTKRNSALTLGNVQMTLEKGVTTKYEVLETFGAPNITTHDSAGREVWTYQRHATVSQSDSQNNYWTVILAGGSNQAAGFEQTMRTITLIIKFDENDVVTDFRSRTSNF